MALYVLQRQEECAPATVNLDRWALGKLAQVADTLPVDAQTVAAAMEGDYASTSHSTMAISIKQFLNWAEVEYGYQNPIKNWRVRKGKSRVPRYFSEEEVDRILSLKLTPLNRALIMTLLNTGVRIGELACLKKQDITLNKDHALLRIPKGKAGPRPVIAMREIGEMLLAIGNETEIWVEHRGSISRKCLSRRVKGILSKAGIDEDRVAAHACRHTFACQFTSKGGKEFQLQELLGHSSLDMTRRYVQIASPLKIEAHAEFAPLMEKSQQVEEPRQPAAPIGMPATGSPLALACEHIGLSAEGRAVAAADPDKAIRAILFYRAEMSGELPLQDAMPPLRESIADLLDDLEPYMSPSPDC